MKEQLSLSARRRRQQRSGLIVLLVTCSLSLISKFIQINTTFGLLHLGVTLAFQLATIYGMCLLMPLHGLYLAAGIGQILFLLLHIPQWLFSYSFHPGLRELMEDLMLNPVYSCALSVTQVLPLLLILGHWCSMRREYPAPARCWLIYAIAQLLASVAGLFTSVLLLVMFIKWAPGPYTLYTTVVKNVNSVLLAAQLALLIWSICSLSRPQPAEPVELTNPVQPVIPEDPATPTQPLAPAEPAAPTEPADPIQ